MICEECNINEATVHMTKIVQGQKEVMHLCESCAMKNESLIFQNPFSIQNFLAGLMDMDSNFIKSPYGTGIECSQCGKSYNDFKKVGKLSCDKCYTTFKPQLKHIIRKIHGNSHHTGKIPKRLGKGIKLKRQINDLKIELQRAIEEEDFEKAAKLRDQIRDLESNMDKI